MYNSYRCLKCGTITTVPTEDVIRMELENRIVRCAFGHIQIVKINPYEGIDSCMSHDTYKKDGGVTKQTGWSR